MISKSIAIKVLNLGLATGADFAEIYLEETLSNSLSLENGQVETSSSNLSYGAGIRLLNKLQSVYGYTNDISLKGLSALAEALSKSFNETRKITVEKIKKVRVNNVHKIERPLYEVPTSEKVALLKDASAIIQGHDPRIVRTQTMMLDNYKKVTIFNSEGKEFHDDRARGRMAMMALAAENGKIETAFEGPGAQSGFEFFTSTIDYKAKALEVAKNAIRILHR